MKTRYYLSLLTLLHITTLLNRRTASFLLSITVCGLRKTRLRRVEGTLVNEARLQSMQVMGRFAHIQTSLRMIYSRQITCLGKYKQCFARG